MSAKTGSAGSSAAEPVAVIGGSCRLPGGVDSLDSLWDLLGRGAGDRQACAN
ncbi:beta-ketoacyl synthase N-terminal-like domain-containing protein [Streptomyces sp. NBC_01525]|uniref:beta-ketoacyl synthase N-terminal-like domain-containing protein n=1 Tax=Streptomyces sp. NBC_01525 TaxID=2903893 RepID=UPI0038657EBE